MVRTCNLIGVVGMSLWLMGCQNDVVYLDKASLDKLNSANTLSAVASSQSPPSQTPIVVRSVSHHSATVERIQKAFQAPLACQATVLQPALFKEKNTKVLVREGARTYTNKTAVTKINSVKVQTMPARFAEETLPAVYKTVVEKIPVKRERYELEVEPAQYRTVIHRQELKPAHLSWREGCFAYTDRANPAATAVVDNNPCLISQAAQVKEIKQQLVDVPPRFSWRLVPAEYVEVERKVLLKAGQGRGLLPAEYRTVDLHHVVENWVVDADSSSATNQYETIVTPVLERAARAQTQVSLCEAQLTERDIQLLQGQLARVSGQALIVSGKMDNATKNALLHYQQQKRLAQGAITLETLQALGF